MGRAMAMAEGGFQSAQKCAWPGMLGVFESAQKVRKGAHKARSLSCTMRHMLDDRNLV